MCSSDLYATMTQPGESIEAGVDRFAVLLGEHSQLREELGSSGREFFGGEPPRHDPAEALLAAYAAADPERIADFFAEDAMILTSDGPLPTEMVLDALRFHFQNLTGQRFDFDSGGGRPLSTDHALTWMIGRTEGVDTKDGLRIDMPMSQSAFGAMLGASRETTNKQLKSWQDEGLINTGRRTVVLVDADRLARSVGLDIES